MPPVIATKGANAPDAARDANAIHELIGKHHEWFMSIDGRSPLSLTTEEFEFSGSYNRLIFSCWTENGARMWRVASWNWSDDKLLLQATRRMGAEEFAIALVPRASAKAIVASIAAARQERCEKLAQIVARSLEGVGGRVLGVGSEQAKQFEYAHQAEFTSRASTNSGSKTLHPTPNPPRPFLELHPTPNTLTPFVKIERATLSPGMRRDQPGRYARDSAFAA